MPVPASEAEFFSKGKYEAARQVQLMLLCAKQRKMQRYEGSRPRRLRRAAAGSLPHSLSIVLRYSLNRHSHNFKPSAQLAHELDSSAPTQFVTIRALADKSRGRTKAVGRSPMPIPLLPKVE